MASSGAISAMTKPFLHLLQQHSPMPAPVITDGALAARHDSAQKLGQAPSGPRLGADGALLVKEVSQIGDVHQAMIVGARAIAAALCSGPDAG